MSHHLPTLPARLRSLLPRRSTRSTLVVAATLTALLSALASVLLTPQADAATLTVKATADAYVRSDAPGTNYGSAYNLAAKSPSSTDSTSITSYVKFTVSGLDAAPSRVLLRVNTYSSNPALKAWAATNDWTESGLTYSNAPVLGTSLGAFPDVKNNSWTELDVSGLVTGSGTYSVGITSSLTTSKTFGSRESGSTGPELSISTDPASPGTTSASPSGTTSASPSATSSPSATDSASATPSDTSSASPTSSPPAVVSTYAAKADAYTVSDQPAQNAGGGYTLYARAPSDGSAEMRTYVRFDVSGLSGPATKAVLRLYSYSNSTDGYAVSSSTNDWTENALTWANQPAAGPGTGSSGTIALNTWAAADVTGAITGNGTYTFVVTTARTVANKFASRESSSNTPALVVTTGSGGATSTATGTPTQSQSASPTPTQSPSPTQTTSSPPVVTPPPGSDPTIVTAGDIACDTTTTQTSSKCQEKATSDLAVGLAPTAVLPLGDDQYELGSLSDFRARYDPTWGRLNSISFPVPGNHEYGYIGSSVQPTGGTGYFSYFGERSHPLDPGCTSQCRSWYSYDIGSWHLIALDSQCGVVGGCNPGNPQYQWLLNDLNTHPSTCTLAYWHIPLYSSSQDHQPDMVSIFKLLYDKGADVVLSGHAHFYERFGPQDSTGGSDPQRGVSEFLVGTGGRSFFSIRATPSANSEARIANTFGVLQMTLRSGTYDWRFVPTAGSTVSDQGSASCH